MLRITQNKSAAGAKNYYTEAGKADYYTKDQELTGIWRGKGAARLGLTGKVEQAAWDALCDNRDPNTGNPLTVRRKNERTVGYDFNFHMPKSVSLLYGLTRDKKILNAFERSVNEEMQAIEADMKTRVRKDGKNEDRVTGNMVWGEFIHFTSRPVDGIPDPHLHAHCFVHNMTFDETEKKFKAGQFRDLKRDAPFFEARFHSRMARRMEELGLEVERTQKGWEIAGLPPVTLGNFSRRTKQVENAAIAVRDKRVQKRLKELGYSIIENEYGWALKGWENLSGDQQAEINRMIEVFSREETLDEVEKSELGARTRAGKQENLSMDQLRDQWASRLNGDEQTRIRNIAAHIGGKSIAERTHVAQEAAVMATDHCFERKSVVPERELLAEALRRGVGHASIQSVERAVAAQKLIVAEREGRRFTTTAAVLKEEQWMIGWARNGRGTADPLGSEKYAVRREWLNEGQRRAVCQVLTSNDRVILIRGAAGTGKTSMMQEAVEAIEAGGHKVFTFAPSAEAARNVLRKEGFANADTVARLLQDEKLQEEVRGNIIWVDEAGLLGARTTARLFDLADKLDARVIFQGDRKQHGAIERGSVLRLLETEAGLIPADLKIIQRQKGAYRQAVEALSEGRIEDGFDQLDQLGWIREVDESERYKVLAADYVSAINAGKSALVVSPTHIEGDQIAREIRAQLKAAAVVGSDERTFTVLHNANLTHAQRTDKLNYADDDVVEFHQNAKGFIKGQRLVAGHDAIPLKNADRFQVYRAATMPIAPGDILRVTKNGKTADGLHRLNNGAIYTVKSFAREGDIVLSNGWTISKGFGHLAHGYVATSHASQGKTVDRVFIGQSSESAGAASREQFYVSVSRGRQQALVYTDEKSALLEAVTQSDERLSATEFVSERQYRERGLAIGRMERLSEMKPEPVRQTRRNREGLTHER